LVPLPKGRFPNYIRLVNHPPIRVWRVVCLTLCFTCLGLLATQAVHRTEWYKNRLFRQLLNGTPNQRLAAATTLAHIGAEDRLLLGVQAGQPEVRELARRGLEHIWFIAAGEKAYKMTEQACLAIEQEQYADAVEILDQVVARYPKYAEGWNRRACLYWQIGEYEKSIVDCERALALNPNHYGAWQGIGVCQLQLGDLAAACHSLRAALKILPHDSATRSSLRRCEELLRSYPSPTSSPQRDYLL
jgi:tetratricopeptide (TPR) repeat protein